MINPFQVELIRIMFSINPLENLKLYISSRPPLVVFMISVSAMAIAFLTLGYFFKIKEIKSPEMAEVCMFSVLSSWPDLDSRRIPLGAPHTFLSNLVKKQAFFSESFVFHLPVTLFVSIWSDSNAASFRLSVMK